ncbi:MAG: Uma2 family endonuclease [Rhizobiaceae bacterium]|nr:Uma2 family endonuclease [Rhizobiaceae bacterium]
MVALPKAKWTASQFLDWSAGQSERYELEGGLIIEMASEQAKHALAKHAAAKALENGVQASGLDWTVFPDGMSVVVDDGHVRLPDAAIQCGPVDLEAVVLDNPVVLVEVVSPSSVNRDETYKLIEYFQVPSVEHYLMISPDQQLVVHFKRAADRKKVETQFLKDGMIELAPPGFSVSVKDLMGSRS